MDPADTLPVVFSILGTVSSAFLQLSPIAVMREIHQKKHVGCFRPDPFITGTGFGLINGTYSLVSDQLISTISTGIGLALFFSYLVYYIYWSDHKSKDLRKTFLFLSIALGLTGVGPLVFKLVDLSVSGHTWTEKNGGLANMILVWLGVCATISIILMYAGQLTNMAYVVKSKDSRSISMIMSIAGLTCSVMWTIYAGFIVNPYYIIANGLGVVAGSTQIILKKVYPNVRKDAVVDEELPAMSATNPHDSPVA